ncbi:MAG TPA: DUF5689 domain-containing protein [Chitinophagales bacterium]|nr:DUF5689 domain-containing protein [Chitinophagales bacterium]
MKSFSIIFKTLLVAVLASTLTTSCIKDKYDEPVQLPDVDPNLEVNLTIEQLKDLYKTEPVQITEDYIISGVVISDDQDGNVYQTLIIQDETGGVGFRVQRTDLFTDFPFGRKVYVKLKGLWVGSFNNLIQIGAADDGQGSVTLISASFVGDFFVKGPRGQVVTPLEIDIADLSSKYQNTLIKLKDVQFIESQAGKVTYADAVKKQNGTTNLEDCNGNKIELRTSGYAKFAGDVVPAGKGDVVAIYQIYKASNQLLINRTSDVQLTNSDRCGGGTVDPPLDTIAPSVPGPDAKLLFPGADFEDFAVFKAQVDSKFGLKPYAVSAIGEGFGGGNALALRGTPGGNDYVFSILASAQATFPVGAKYISFYVKGKTTAVDPKDLKSISINVQRSNGTNYDVFNALNLSSNALLKASTEIQSNGNGTNDYRGVIDTKDKWVLVTLDIAELDVNRTNTSTIFSIKVGSKSTFDLLIDNIVVW